MVNESHLPFTTKKQRFVYIEHPKFDGILDYLEKCKRHKFAYIF